MLSKSMQKIYLTLENIVKACKEFQLIMDGNIHKTTNSKYKTAYEEDKVLFENIKDIATTVMNDIGNNRINLSTELLLRLAAGPISKKIDLISENRMLRKELIENIKAVHKNIYALTIAEGMR